MKNIRLNRQLRKAGATRQEARELSAITSDLRNSVPHLDASVKQQIAQQIGLRQRPIYAKPRFAVAGALAAIVILSIAAQFAQPGSPLYALKRATEEVRVIIQPSFKAEIQQRRHDEQKKIDEQQKIEDNQNDGINKGEDNSGSGSSSGGIPLKVEDSGSGSGKTEDIKVDTSGSGSGSGSVDVKTPEVKVDTSGRSIDASGSGGSNEAPSVDQPKL